MVSNEFRFAIGDIVQGVGTSKGKTYGRNILYTITGRQTHECIGGIQRMYVVRGFDAVGGGRDGTTLLMHEFEFEAIPEVASEV